MVAGLLLLLPVLLTQDPAPGSAGPPNVVLILADDLGWGDPGCYNPHSRVPTPNLDRLAAEGTRFTDAHSPSAVCSPTRYGLLTGRYAWRSRLKRGVLWGDDRLLVEEGRPTLGELMRRAGYATACIGKWHLGLGRFDPTRPGAKADFSRPFDAGPHTLGFDRSLVLPASLDIPPYVLVEDGRARSPLAAETPGSRLRRLGGGGFWRPGPMAAGFSHQDLLPELTAAATAWIRRRRAEEPDRPFFLYFPLTAPHTPWLPAEEFRGRSGAGPYGDFVAQVDAVVGEVLAALEASGAAAETLVFFTSDNGAHWLVQDRYQWGHEANGPWRGQKADIHEGGHRVPLLARWPGRVPAGAVREELVGLNDLYATLAELVGRPLAPGEAPDSVSFLGPLLGAGVGGRQELVLHSFDGMFALRAGRWKLCEGLGSGGFTQPARIDPVPGGPRGQLYDLAEDPRERFNLWQERPEVVRRLRARLAAIRASEG